MRVVATAGHVDHGKSSLVLALTGTDPDRFAEEKARGLTIDLGFAFTALPSGTEVGFVDVPGHERFVKNMLAGVGAVDVALFVVAAGEGWKPQSEEHLRILDLLDVHHGMVAVTKADTVTPDLLELTRLDVVEHLATSSLGGAPVVALRLGVRSRPRRRARHARPRARRRRGTGGPRPTPPLDRPGVRARGAGTVVTGTLIGGAVATDDALRIVRLDRSVRVRGIESAHRSLERVGPGARVALNLVGVDHHDLARGDVLVRGGEWPEATRRRRAAAAHSRRAGTAPRAARGRGRLGRAPGPDACPRRRRGVRPAAVRHAAAPGGRRPHRAARPGPSPHHRGRRGARRRVVVPRRLGARRTRPGAAAAPAGRSRMAEPTGAGPPRRP